MKIFSRVLRLTSFLIFDPMEQVVFGKDLLWKKRFFFLKKLFNWSNVPHFRN